MQVYKKAHNFNVSFELEVIAILYFTAVLKIKTPTPFLGKCTILEFYDCLYDGLPQYFFLWDGDLGATIIG